MNRLKEIKEKLLIKHNLSMLDINWKALKQGELSKLLKWEIKRDKRNKNILGV